MTAKLLADLSREEVDELPYSDVERLHGVKEEKQKLVSALEQEFDRHHLLSSSVQDLRKLAENTESVVIKYEAEMEKEAEKEIEGAFAGLRNLGRIIGDRLKNRFSGLINFYSIVRSKK